MVGFVTYLISFLVASLIYYNAASDWPHTFYNSLIVKCVRPIRSGGSCYCAMKSQLQYKYEVSGAMLLVLVDLI